MWKLITIAALAASVMSAPAMAQKPRSHYQEHYYSYQGGSSETVPSSNLYGGNY